MNRFFDGLDTLIGWITAGLLAVAYALSVYSVFERYVIAGSGTDWIWEVVVFGIVWAVLLSVARIEHRRAHIRMDIVWRRFSDAGKVRAEYVSCSWAWRSACFLSMPAGSSYRTPCNGTSALDSSLRLPYWVYYAALSSCFAVLPVRRASSAAPCQGHARTRDRGSDQLSLLLLIIGFLAVCALLVLGVPIYVVLGSVAIGLLLSEGVTVAGLGQHALDHLNTPVLVSVPFFLLAAVTMRGGGIAKVLFDAALTWIGWMRGGLAIAGVAATAVFAAINGSSMATALAMGTLLVPLLIDNGYKPSFAMGLTAAAATLGILIPPSLPMILIGIIAEESVPRLFIGGVIPGLLQAALFGLYIYVVADRVGGHRLPKAGREEFFRKNIHAFPAYSIPVVVLGGIYGGFVTLTEAAVLGATIAIIAVLFIYRSGRLGDLRGLFSEAIDRTGVVVVKIIGATLLSLWIIKSGLPQGLARAVAESGLQPWQFLTFMNIFLIIMGMFLEGVAIILIVLPIVAPIVKTLGIDMTHFGVVMIINIELALLSPPIGLNLFIMANVTRRPVGEVIRGTVPFFMLMLALLMLVTYVPAVTLWLPNLAFGKSP
ncbi:MAG: TRAP transporter large permease subunit [Burkholderiaceae bacterium]